jgi:hypothetical protein
MRWPSALTPISAMVLIAGLERDCVTATNCSTPRFVQPLHALPNHARRDVELAGDCAERRAPVCLERANNGPVGLVKR